MLYLVILKNDTEGDWSLKYDRFVYDHHLFENNVGGSRFLEQKIVVEHLNSLSTYLIRLDVEANINFEATHGNVTTNSYEIISSDILNVTLHESKTLFDFPFKTT